MKIMEIEEYDKIAEELCAARRLDARFLDADCSIGDVAPKVERSKNLTCRKRKSSSTDVDFYSNKSVSYTRSKKRPNNKGDCQSFVPTLQGLISDAKEQKSLQSVAPVLQDVLEKVLSVEHVDITDSEKTITEETVKVEESLKHEESIDSTICPDLETTVEEDTLINLILAECQDSGIDLAEICKNEKKMRYFDSLLSKIKHLNDSMKSALRDDGKSDEEVQLLYNHIMSGDSDTVEYADDFSATNSSSKVDDSRNSSFTNVSTTGAIRGHFEACNDSNRSMDTFTLKSMERHKKEELYKEYIGLCKRNEELKRCNYVLHDLMASRLVNENISNSVAELQLCDEQSQDEYTQKLLEYGQIKKDLDAFSANHSKVVKELKIMRAERMAILQKEFYCLLIREKEVASGLQGRRSKIPIHEKVIEKYLRLQQQKMSELGAARLLFIRQKNRINCLISENRCRNGGGNIRTQGSSECDDFHNCNCYGTGDDISELSFGRDFNINDEEVAQYHGLISSLDDKQIKDKLQGTLRIISKKNKELQELYTDSEDIKERLEALKSEKESVRKERERLEKKSNITKNIKPGTVTEFTSYIDKTKELTEQLQKLKDGYASDQAKLESMRRQISYMAHLKRKDNKPVVAEPDNPTLQYQGRLSRTGLCPALRRNPINSVSNRTAVNAKKPVFKATLSGQPCKALVKCDSARTWNPNSSGPNSVIQVQAATRHPKMLPRSTSLNRNAVPLNNARLTNTSPWKVPNRNIVNQNARNAPKALLNVQKREPWRKY